MLLLVAGGKTIAYGQTEQGNVRIAGSFSISGNEYNSINNNSVNTSKNRSLSISPSVGFFIRENLEVGAGIGYGLFGQRSKYGTSSNKERGHSYNFSTYLRKYIPIIDKLYFHGTGTVSLGFGESLYEYRTDSSATSKSETKFNFLSISLSPGITYFVTDRFALSTSFGSIGYGRSVNKPKEASHTLSNSFGIDLGLETISFGLNYFINRQ